MQIWAVIILVRFFLGLKLAEGLMVRCLWNFGLSTGLIQFGACCFRDAAGWKNIVKQ